MTKIKYKVIIPADIKPYPKPHEISAAMLLAQYFRSNVYFVKTSNRSTPGVSIRGVVWEIKSPIGNSHNNIQKNMREAAHQASNIVIDLRRSKLHQARALGYIKQFLSNPNYLKRVLVITKTEKTIAIK